MIKEDEALKLALEALTYIYTETTTDEDELIDQAITAIKKSLAQPEQEPVAYLSNKRQRINIEIKPQTFVEIPTVTDWEMPLYMKPPQRTWVGLTDEEMMDAIYVDDTPMERGRRVEAKLKDKNNNAKT